MNTPSVSVIIPAYRAAATIERAVDSVLTQTYPATEILIIDDGSPDDLQAPLERYGDQVTLIRKPNGGAASARNLGIDRAGGDLLAFLDADDYWEPTKLQRHAELYQRFPELGLTHGNYFNQEPGGQRQSDPLEAVEFDRLTRVQGSRAFARATTVWTGTVVAPRQLVGEDRFVSGLEPAEDRDFWVRQVVKAPIYCVSEPLATAVLEPESLSRSSVGRDCENMLNVVARHRDLLGWRGARKWNSHTRYRWAALTEDAGEGLRQLLHSFWLWPLPYGRSWVRMPLARVRLLIRLVRQWASRSKAPARVETAEPLASKR